ncbi:hypothetical protein [Azospirillum sp.]|uniref:hypothetical protein n=1 Tax=Azospirillum sp. TaxID=34012 RepID=UPI002D4F286B|nr:hypothetical protein [Azospirillum sp.]HYD67521.1 hypothetical protein [Azospirillum sp.]
MEPRVLDGRETEAEARTALRQAVEEADDCSESLDVEDVFSDIRKMLTEMYGLTR